MARAFISYSSKSKALVEALVQDIETAGYQPWFDHKLTGGQAWWEQILAQIRECDLFVFALTPDALDSVPCQREYQYAHQIGKNILPVLLMDGVSVNLLPLELSTIQFVDYRQPDRQSGIRLISALNGLPPQTPLPDPLPPPPEVPISYIGNLKDQIEAPGGLTFEDQASLVLKLKTLLQETDQPQDAIELLHRFKRRKDLLALIDKEIDGLLASASGAAPAAAPPPPQAAPAASTPRPETSRPRGPDPFAASADPFASTTTSARPTAQPARPTRPPSTPPRESAPATPWNGPAGRSGWVPALITATVGWGIVGTIISVPLLLLLFGGSAVYVGFAGLVLRGVFALLAGALSGVVTHRALRSGLPALGTAGQQRMVIWFAVTSVQEVIVQFLLGGSDGGDLISLAITWGIITWVTLGVLRSQWPAVSGRAIAIAWGVAHILFFFLFLSAQGGMYWMDLGEVVLMLAFLTILGNGLIGFVGVGLTLRALPQSVAPATPERAGTD